MGSDKAVKRQGRQVLLDKRYCWVDAWAFEVAAESLQAIHELPPQSTTAEDVRAAEKAINIYKGHFLPEDTRRIWTASTRLRLQNKFRNVATLLGVHLEQTGQWKKAAAHYQKTIEVDGLAEAFYQHLMVCYQNLGQRAQGIEVYHHLKNTLFAALGITPSPETETIHQSLLSNSNKP